MCCLGRMTVVVSFGSAVLPEPTIHRPCLGLGAFLFRVLLCQAVESIGHFHHCPCTGYPSDSLWQALWGPKLFAKKKKKNLSFSPFSRIFCRYLLSSLVFRLSFISTCLLPFFGLYIFVGCTGAPNKSVQPARSTPDVPPPNGASLVMEVLSFYSKILSLSKCVKHHFFRAVCRHTRLEQDKVAIRRN